MDDLQPFFESRETRASRLPEDVRSRFETAAVNARDTGDTEFEDRQFSALWLAQRTGIPRRQILDNFDGIASRFFGPGVTAAGAYDAIAAQYKAAGAGAQEDTGEGDKGPQIEQDGAEWAPVEGFPKPGVQVLMENVSQATRAFMGGFEEFAQRVPAGLYSQAGAATGFRVKALRDDPEFSRLSAENAKIDPTILETDNPFQLPANTGSTSLFGMSRMSDEQVRMLFDPETQPERDKTVAENRTKIEAAAERVDRENVEGLKQWRESTRGELSTEYRRLADFWYGLSEAALDRRGVSAEFADSAFGQFMRSAGSVPATAALAAMGPGGVVGLESAFFADVESERMRSEGAAYDPVKALPDNLASALPQMAMERAFGVERLMNKILAELPKQAGKVTFGDFAKQFVRRGLAAGVEEGITEPSQGFWNDYLASLTYDENRETLTGDGAKRRLIESVSGFTLGALFGGGLTAVEAVDRNRAVAKATGYITGKTGEPLTGAEFSALRTVKTDAEILASAPDEATGRIMLAAANGDVQAQAAYNKLTLGAKFVNTEGAELGGLSVGVVENVPVVRMADGVVLPIDMTDGEERQFFTELKQEIVRRQALTETTEFLGRALEQGRTLEISEQQRTLQDFVNESKLEVEDAVQRIGIARDVNAITIPSDANPEDVRVLGTNVSEYSAGVYRDVSTVYAGGNALTAVEEVAEGYVKKRLAVGDLNEAELQTWRDSYEKETGEKTSTTGTVSNIEWFSKRAVDYAVANRKMEGMPKSWGSFLRTLGEHLKTVLRLSQKLVKLKRDGKLDANFEGNLKAALGMAPVPKASAAQQVPQQGQPGGMMSTFALAEPTESEAFKKWFGKSKVVDAQGKPLVVYHGTRATVSAGFTFDYARIGDQGRSEGAGFYFTNSRQIAQGYGAGGTVIEAFLNIQKPMAYDEKPFNKATLAKLITRIAEMEAELDGSYVADGFLSNYGDVNYDGLSSVVRSAVNGLVADETALDQISGIVGSGVSPEIVNKAVREVTGFDGVVAKGFENRGSDNQTIYVAFFPEQIKSATGNRGTFDPTNPDITFALTGVPTNQLQALQAQAQRIRSKKLMATGELIRRIQAGQPIPQRVRNVRRTAQASLAARLLVPISTRLRELSPSLAVRLRRFEFDSAQSLTRDYQRVLPFAQAMEQMRDADAAILDLALKNGDTDARDAVLAAYNAQGAFAQVEAVIAELKDRAIAAGYEVGTVENYFPRKVADLDGLMTFYYGKPQEGAIGKAIKEAAEKALAQGRILTHEEQIEVVNTALRGYARKDTKPGNLKTRTTEVVSNDANKFYTDSITALSYYIEQMNAAVEKRRFFGKYSVAVPGVPGANTSRLNLEASIGGVVNELIATGELDRKGQAEVQAILEARFNQQASSEFIKNFKALAYMSTMGHITSGLTQIQDVAFSLYENGVYDTIISGVRAMVRQSKVSRKDLGLESPAEEFRDTGKMHKAVDRVFKLVGIHYLDLIGKETLTNAKLRKMQREARSGKLSKRSASIIGTVFGPQQGAQVVADLAEGKITDDVKFAVYNVLADYQPISLTEYPEYYLRHPNGRVFYMLKTFTLKQIDAFRREAITQMVRGNAKQKAEGFRNLIHLAGVLFMVGVPVDWLKDWIMMRDPQLPDLAVDNLFKLLGVNRWSLWQFRENPDPVRAALLLAAPPAPFLTYPFMDVKDSAKAISKGDDIKPGEFESWRMLPFIGSPLYWYLGGGREKVEKRAKKRAKESSGDSRIKR
jgi:hypothetical protein